MWLCHTSAIQLDISYALGWFLGVKLSQNLSLSLWTLSGFANVFFFFNLFFFFNSQGQMLGWCLQFTTPMYLASCCCYLGKLQTVQKALCFRGTVNSHLGMSPFFLLWVKFCLGCGCKELRSMLCDAKPESWGASFAGVWPKFGTNSAKLMLMLGCFRMMLHNMSQRRWGVSSEWLLHKCTSFFSALICNFYWKSLAFSPRSWRVMSLPRAGFFSPGTVDSQTPEESLPSSLQGKIWLISQTQTSTWFSWCQD